MSDKLKTLLDKKLITLFDYDTYVLFELQPLAKTWLKNAVDSWLMYIPGPSEKKEYIGRLAIFREIRECIQFVNNEMRQLND